MFGAAGPTLFELAEQALSSTDRGYDLLAPKFDRTPFRTPDVVLEAAARAVGSAARTLDVCAGTGAAMRAFAPVTRELVVGVDRSRGMLDEARRQLGPGRFRLVRADALAMPFDGAFDLAVSFGAFGHILESDEERFVREVRRALAPGGRFVFATAELPPVASRAWWLSRGFNAVMRVRNALWHPPFIMYYLTFHLARARELLTAAGFDVDVRDAIFPRPFHRMVLVIATRRG